MAFCDKCASKRSCGKECTGFVPNGRFYIEGRKRYGTKRYGDMRQLEDCENRRGRELRRPVDYAE